MQEIRNELGKPVGISIRANLTYKEKTPTTCPTWGSDEVAFDLYYHITERRLMVIEIGAFGDGTVVANFDYDENATIRDILEDFAQICEMPYDEFRKILEANRLWQKEK